MTLTKITDAANAYTDENFEALKVMYFVNEAISKINSELKCELPIFEDVETDYTALATKWIISLFVPYACYSIKMNDGSLNEADRYLVTFNENLLKLIDNKDVAIDEDYREDDFDEIYQRDLSNGIDFSLFGRANTSEDEGFE
jgi:hypothetical protein